MKVKLLKKARKQFKILHYVNRNSVKLINNHSEYYPVVLTELLDHTDNAEHNAKSFKEATNKLKDYIVDILKTTYPSLGRKRQAKNAYENKFKQIWP